MIAFPDNLCNQIKKCAIVAVVTVDVPSQAVQLGQVLTASGIGAIELTLRTSHALECMRAIADSVPEILIGAGTVITPHQVQSVKSAGATFAVAPGCNAAVLEEADKLNLPFAAGVATPSDIERALTYGANTLKYFPAETSGGLKHLEAMAAPFRHLGIRYIPLGGLTSSNFISYFQSKDCLAIGGSWIASPDLIAREAWDTISHNCRAAVSAVQAIQPTL